MQKAPYYGQIEEIWELNYLEFKVALFKCRWVQGSLGVTCDKNGFVSVDLRNVGYKTEPFVLAKDVLQVFYLPDTVRMTLHIVLPGKRRIVGVHNAVDEEELINLMKSLLLQLMSSPAEMPMTRPRTFGPTTTKKSV